MDENEKASMEEKKEEITRLIKERNFIQNEVLNHLIKSQESSIRQIELSNGVILGLSVGIAGGFLAQFVSVLLEGFFLSRYDNLFFGSIFGFVISLAAVIVIISYYFKIRRKEEKYLYVNLSKSEKDLLNRIDQIEIELEDLRLGLSKE